MSCAIQGFVLYGLCTIQCSVPLIIVKDKKKLASTPKDSYSACLWILDKSVLWGMLTSHELCL